MAIQKKSLISNRAAAKKALLASRPEVNVTSTPSAKVANVTTGKVQLGKVTAGKIQLGKFQTGKFQTGKFRSE